MTAKRPSRGPSSRFQVTVLTCALTLGLGSTAEAPAQPMDLATPADSPLWWTLTPDLSPEDLRREYQDPGATLRRYQEAVDAGLEEPRSDEDLARLKFYTHPRIQPEITTFWEALTIFSQHLNRRGDEAVADDLATSGISKQGQDRIISSLHRLHSEAEDIMSVSGPKQRRFLLLLIEAKKEGHPEAALEWARANEDAEYLAAVTSVPKAELEDLMDAMKISPSQIASEAALLQLKETLSASDWDRLRAHLLEVMRTKVGPFKDF